jgi:hypothetical protein
MSVVPNGGLPSVPKYQEEKSELKSARMSASPGFRSRPRIASARASGYQVSGPGRPPPACTKLVPALPSTFSSSGVQLASTRIGTGDATSALTMSTAASNASRAWLSKPL